MREENHDSAHDQQYENGYDYDYTEGASTSDIEHALSEAVSIRRRRDSQVGNSYEAPTSESFVPSTYGSVFDGPGNVAIPSSSSRMRGMSADRNRHLRRMSYDSTLDGHGHEGGQTWRRSEELGGEKGGSASLRASRAGGRIFTPRGR